MGEKGKCGASVVVTVKGAVVQPCISPLQGGKVKNFSNKKK